MRPVQTHIPGHPESNEPPPELVALIDRFNPVFPVVRWGLTATTDGRWALLVSVPPDTEVPLAEMEAISSGYPVVYETEPELPIRPIGV